MTELSQHVRRHWAALLLALLFSLLCVFPQIAFRVQHAHDGVYQGIELLPDSSWPPRVREIMDGHGFGSIYFKEGKSDPYLFQPGGSITVAYMGEALGLDINNTLLLSRAVLPFVVFLLIYAFALLLTGDTLVALSGASVLLLADAVGNLSAIKNLLHGVSPSNFLNIDLPVDPAMIYLPFFAFLICFWLFYARRDWRWGVASALVLGANFYTYFYSWTYLYAFGGLLVLMYLLQRNWREALRLASVFVGALVVAIPYALNLYRASHYATYAEVGLRDGIIYTHAPAFVGIVVIAALLIYLAAFWRGESRRYWFGLALLLTPFITLNQQLITGRVIQPAHYHWYFHKPIATLFVLVAVFYVLGRYATRRYQIALAVLIILGSFAIGTFTQIDSYLHNRGDGGTVAVARQQYGPVMQWLNAHAHTGDVVLANNPISYLITIYTPFDVFSHRADQYSLSATDERLLDILDTFYRLRGVSASQAHDVFYAERGDISWAIYGEHYRQLYGSAEAIPNEKLDAIVAGYQATLTTPTPMWLKAMLAKYQVSYVVWDTAADPTWHLERYSFLHKEVTLGTISIYSVAP